MLPAEPDDPADHAVSGGSLSVPDPSLKEGTVKAEGPHSSADGLGTTPAGRIPPLWIKEWTPVIAMAISGAQLIVAMIVYALIVPEAKQAMSKAEQTADDRIADIHQQALFDLSMASQTTDNLKRISELEATRLRDDNERLAVLNASSIQQIWANHEQLARDKVDLAASGEDMRKAKEEKAKLDRQLAAVKAKLGEFEIDRAALTKQITAERRRFIVERFGDALDEFDKVYGAMALIGVAKLPPMHAAGAKFLIRQPPFLDPTVDGVVIVGFDAELASAPKVDHVSSGHQVVTRFGEEWVADPAAVALVRNYGRLCGVAIGGGAAGPLPRYQEIFSNRVLGGQAEKCTIGVVRQGEDPLHVYAALIALVAVNQAADRRLTDNSMAGGFSRPEVSAAREFLRDGEDPAAGASAAPLPNPLAPDEIAEFLRSADMIADEVLKIEARGIGYPLADDKFYVDLSSSGYHVSPAPACKWSDMVLDEALFVGLGQVQKSDEDGPYIRFKYSPEQQTKLEKFVSNNNLCRRDLGLAVGALEGEVEDEFRTKSPK